MGELIPCYPFARESPNWCFSSMAGRCIPELFEVHRSRQIERGGYTANCANHERRARCHLAV